ncbi:hypothetical protein [Prescottella agglutinans]|uniref:hypothetical protein n=1 Tax=Prescottella agglutinans TaxID=1644129 RepID=UPI003D987A66
MDLTPYVTALQNDLAVAAEAGGPEARALAERLTAPLDSAVRLALLDALSAAANEITRDLAPGSVDLRLRGREPGFVVTPPPAPAAFDEPAAPEEAPTAPPRPADVEDGPMTRINLRLTQDLKDRVEDAARAAGLSVNAWLVRAATAALDENATPRRPERRAPIGGDRFTGWVR